MRIQYANQQAQPELFHTAPLKYYKGADLMEEKEDIDELRAEISGWKGFDDSLKRLRPDLPDKLYTILQRLLSIDPTYRPTADEVL
ncbi:hypothetical protein F66182_18251, partial [Fusarium sp. NRRL 66182]